MSLTHRQDRSAFTSYRHFTHFPMTSDAIFRNTSLSSNVCAPASSLMDHHDAAAHKLASVEDSTHNTMTSSRHSIQTSMTSCGEAKIRCARGTGQNPTFGRESAYMSVTSQPGYFSMTSQMTSRLMFSVVILLLTFALASANAGMNSVDDVKELSWINATHMTSSHTHMTSSHDDVTRNVRSVGRREVIHTLGESVCLSVYLSV